MNIIILCKRRPQNKDIWERPAGRFYNLAKNLAKLGHTIDFVLLNYGQDEEFIKTRENITWHSVNLFPNPFHIYTYVLLLARQNKPDWIVGFSDVYFGILAVWVAGKVCSKSLVDAYDNYESYLPWCKPLHWLWRLSLKKADCISAPGYHLLDKMRRKCVEQKQCVLAMAADEHFFPYSKKDARAIFGLPENTKIIGYCGSAHATRDMQVFFRAVEILLKKHSDYIFVMTGYIGDNICVPAPIKHLGYIADELMPKMVSSLDLMVSACPDSAFGNYSYPVKIYEAMACNTQVIASETPAISEVLNGDSTHMFPVGNALVLAEKIELLLSTTNTQKVIDHETWTSVALKLQDCLVNTK